MVSKTLEEEIKGLKKEFSFAGGFKKIKLFGYVCDLLLDTNECARIYEKYMTPEQIQEASKEFIKLKMGN